MYILSADEPIFVIFAGMSKICSVKKMDFLSFPGNFELLFGHIMCKLCTEAQNGPMTHLIAAKLCKLSERGIPL